MVLDLYQIVVAGYAASSWQACRLQYPNIIMASDMELGKSFFVLLQDLINFFCQLVFYFLLLLVILNFLLVLIFSFVFFRFLYFFLFLFFPLGVVKLAVDRFQPFFMFLFRQAFLIKFILSQYFPFLIRHYLRNFFSINYFINILNILSTHSQSNFSPQL